MKTKLRQGINDTWKEIYYQLGRNKSHPLSDDDFLKAHWIMYFKYSRQKGNDYIRDLLEVSFESCELMIKQVKTLFKRARGIRSLVSTIDLNESRCDHIERGIITKIFDSDLDPFQKLQLKEMVVNMGEISDQTDRISKRINIISMKRRV